MAAKPLKCEPYVAVPDLREETVQNCPICDKEICECEDTDVDDDDDVRPEAAYPSPPASTSSAPATSPPPSPPRRKPGPLQKTPNDEPMPLSSSQVVNPVPEYLLPPSPPIQTNLSRLDYKSKYACQRASPLVCPNQALAVELDIIKRSRALEGEERSALSYSRAISAVKGTPHSHEKIEAFSSWPSAYPHRITSMRQVGELPHVGTKITGLVRRFGVVRIYCEYADHASDPGVS